MSLYRSYSGSLGGEEAFAPIVLVRAVGAIFAAGVLSQIGPGEVWAWIAISLGVAFGMAAPGRWGAGIALAAAASFVVMGLFGYGEAAAGLLAFPGAVVGSWLRPRVEAGEPVAWIDAMLIGAASEAALVGGMAVTLIPAALVAMPLGMIVPALGWAAGGVVMAAACGWMHVAYGRAMHRMLPQRFGGFALGQVLPITVLALTGGEPLVLLIVAMRSFCLWWGHLQAEGDEMSSEAVPRITVSPGRRRAGTSLWRRG